MSAHTGLIIRCMLLRIGQRRLHALRQHRMKLPVPDCCQYTATVRPEGNASSAPAAQQDGGQPDAAEGGDWAAEDESAAVPGAEEAGEEAEEPVRGGNVVLRLVDEHLISVLAHHFQVTCTVVAQLQCNVPQILASIC